VENSNRYLVELLRILSEQFKTSWPNVLSLATLLVNSVPRPQLKNHSPYFIIFQKEPFENDDFFAPKNEKYLDLKNSK
jgi:hypothetical protein